MASRSRATMDDPPVASGSLQRLVPKRDRVKAALRAFIRDLSPGAALPPILALCQQFQVSQHTIDRVLGDLRAEGLVESRRRSGVYVAQPPAKTLTIGILSRANLLSRDSGFYGLLAMALHQCARPEEIRFRHYFFLAFEGTESYDHLLADAHSGQLDGVLGLGTGDQFLQSLGLPSLGSDSPGWVGMDGTALLRLAAEELAARGRTRIALFYHDPLFMAQAPNVPRMEVTAFQEALSCAGLLTRPSWVMPLSQVDRAPQFWGYEEFHRLWQQDGARPDGLICVDDHATLGALFAADKLGVRLPDNLLIASHANSTDPLPSATQVMRLEFDVPAAARALLTRLQARIAGHDADQPPLLLPPRLSYHPTAGSPSVSALAFPRAHTATNHPSFGGTP